MTREQWIERYRRAYSGPARVIWYSTTPAPRRTGWALMVRSSLTAARLSAVAIAMKRRIPSCQARRDSCLISIQAAAFALTRARIQNGPGGILTLRRTDCSPSVYAFRVTCLPGRGRPWPPPTASRT